MDRELETRYRVPPPGTQGGRGDRGRRVVALILILLPGWSRLSWRGSRCGGGEGGSRRPGRGGRRGFGDGGAGVRGVISSPVEARVEKVLKRPGDLVKAGDPILALDTSSARLDLGKLEDQLAREGQRAAAAPDQPGAQPQRPARPDRGPEARRRGARLPAGAEPQAARRRPAFRSRRLKASEVEAKKAEIRLDAASGRPSRRPGFRRTPQLQGSSSIWRRCARSATTLSACSSSPPPARTAPASSPGSSSRRAPPSAAAT